MTAGESDLSLSGAIEAVQPMSASKASKKRRRTTFWRVRDDIPRQLEVVLMLLSILAPLGIWTLLSVLHAVNPIFLPSPTKVVSTAIHMASNGTLWDDTWASSRRVAIGFGISLMIAIPLGLAMGTFRSMQALFEPAIGLIRYAPATAFVVLLVIWLGLGEESKIALIVLGTVFFNTLMTANAVWQVPSELIKVSQTLGASSGTVFRKVIFPYAMPGLFDTARVNLAAAWNLIVVTEIFNADHGLGRLIVRSQKFLQIDQIFVAIIVIGVLGVGSDLLLRFLRDRAAPWSQE